MDAPYISASVYWRNDVCNLSQPSVIWERGGRAASTSCNLLQLRPNLPLSHVNGALLDRHCRFLDGFRQRGVCMTRPRQIF